MPNNSKQFIENAAFQVREDYDFTNPEIDLFQLGQEVGIDIQTQYQQNHGISGALIRNGNDFLIFYSSSINNIPYQRFSIAHEFGHYFLPEHPENILKEGAHFSSAGAKGNTKDPYEKEADYFSTCLLMPKSLFESEMYKFNDGMEAIKALANIFNTSLTTTAIRYIELSEAPALLIISSNGLVDAVFSTKELRKFGNCLYTKNSIFPQKNIVFTEVSKKEIYLSEWLDTEHSVKALEESLTLGSYEKTLTVVTTSTIYDEIEEDTNDEIWAPPSFK